ncbi:MULTISPECIES: FecCD family ABC transporter permease [Hungatella]|jgi:iron complex transport system permease protein|uniref:Transport system permease n=1 Tax=Hungatella hathewayi TaxID=154046 RepID=A0A174NNB4_9FIRM|nr:MULTISPECIES: iron ABC transporter permease [Hungatella]CUP48377.1 transport system permease [Hungatella hathewayi]
MADKHRVRGRLTAMVVLFAVCFFGSFMLGRYPIEPWTLIRVLASRVIPVTPDWPSQVETVLFNVRLPRVLMAALIGAGLSAAGAAYQGIFKNPMVSPDVLGASSGAGFGAALGLFLSFSYQGVSFLAFVLGLSAVGAVCLISSRVKYNQTLGLVLAGMMISSLFTAAVSFLKLVADPNNTLPVITYWLMGSLASIRPKDLAFAAPWIIGGIIPIYLLRWKINVLTLGEEEARCIGVNTSAVRLAVVLCATLITSAAVSVSGLIGWVGLVIPHFARMLVGSDYRKMLPASLLLGASFLLVVDNFARLLATSEIPIGILTAFVGAPFFLWLILREGNKL